MYLRNSIKTPDGTDLISLSPDDVQEHKDANGHLYSIVGGVDFQLIKQPEEAPAENTSIQDIGDHELRREHLHWIDSSLGKRTPIKIKSLKGSFLTELINKAALGGISLSKLWMDTLVDEMAYRNTHG